MYKILTHLHTQSPGVYRFLMIDDVEFATDSLDEAAAMAKQVLTKVGYEDMKIVDDKDFYIEVTSYSIDDITKKEIELLESVLAKVGTDDISLSAPGDYEIGLLWGKKSEPVVPTYVIDIQSPEDIMATPNHIEVEEHGDIELVISSVDKMGPYHLIINGEECTTGIPTWITFELLDDYTGKAILKDITQDYTITIVPDVE